MGSDQKWASAPANYMLVVPVGLEGLVTYKYKLYGSGQTVAEYAGANRKKFLHEKMSCRSLADYRPLVMTTMKSGVPMKIGNITRIVHSGRFQR